MALPWVAVTDKDTEARAGVLIVRIWAEPNTSSGFRARIIQTLDLSEPEEEVSAADSAEDVCNSVRRWIEAFVSSLD